MKVKIDINHEIDNKDNRVGIYLFKVKNKNTEIKREACSKLTIKTSKQRHWRRSVVFVVNFEHILHLVLGFLLLTYNCRLGRIKRV